MNEETKTQNNSPPDSAPITGQTKQYFPQIDIVKQKIESIPEITITESEQGITILYAPSTITREAVAQLLQWIEARTDSRFIYILREPEAPLLILLSDIHYTEEQPKEIVFKDVPLKPAHELVTQQLDKTNIDSLKTIIVKEAELKPVLPLLGLHEELEKVRAYEKLKEQRDRDVLKAWLTSEKPQSDFMRETGIKNPQGVNKLIHRSLHKIFANLPPKIQEQYGGSAKEAIKRKTTTQLQTKTSRERIKKGGTGKEKTFTKPRGRPKGIVEEQPRKYKERAGRLKGIVETQPRKYKERTGRPKGRTDSQPRKARELSHTHKQNMSESLKRYHQEQKTQQQTPPHEEHTIIDLTKPPQER